MEILMPRRIGASEGIRTLDIHLGKVTLYQTELRSLPKKFGNATASSAVCKISFASITLPQEEINQSNHAQTDQ